MTPTPSLKPSPTPSPTPSPRPSPVNHVRVLPTNPTPSPPLSPRQSPVNRVLHVTPKPFYSTIPWAFGNVEYHKHDDISMVIIVTKELEAILDEYYISESKRLNRWRCPRPFGQKIRDSALDKNHLKQFQYVLNCRNKFAHDRGEDSFNGDEKSVFIDISRQLFLELYRKHKAVDVFPDCDILERKNSLQILDNLIDSSDSVKAMMKRAESEYGSFTLTDFGLVDNLIYWTIAVLPIGIIFALSRK